MLTHNRPEINVFEWNTQSDPTNEEERLKLIEVLPNITHTSNGYSWSNSSVVVHD